MGSVPTSSFCGVQLERPDRKCFCSTLDHDALFEAVEHEVGDPDFCAA
jgi:hypothetical protein